MDARFSKVVPSLRMFDAAKAREFYLDFLGFTVDFEHRFEPDLPLFMQVSMDGAILHLTEHHGDCSPGARIRIEMTGLAGYQAKLMSKRYGYARPGLIEEPWGATTMTVTDPFFNHLVFSERRADTAAA
jgi:catechol 2,3-dioxygenase-like lactoylglutathione lyase family enzyme